MVESILIGLFANHPDHNSVKITIIAKMFNLVLFTFKLQT